MNEITTNVPINSFVCLFAFQNASIDLKEHLNGNGNGKLDSLGFGFNVGIEPDKVKDSSLIQDFERIQKDTTDFCNIQVCLQSNYYTKIQNTD